jgi:hypothetical protein
MKRFTIIEQTPILMLRYFEVEAESEDEAFRKLKEGIDEDDPIEPFRVDYEENLDEPMYYINCEEEVNP